MNLIRTSILNGLAVAVRLVSAVVLNKILAVYVGPAGYAIIGQFQNAMSMVLGIASGTISNGVTKLTAESFDDTARQRSLWKTAGTLVIIASVISSSLILIFQYPLARYFLNNVAFASVFRWFAVALIFISLNAFLLSILNGKKETRRYVVSNIVGSVAGLCIVGILTWQFKLYGALLALSVYQAVIFLFTLLLCMQASWFRLNDLFGSVDRQQMKALGHFALMALTTAILAPLSQIIVRNHLGIVVGWNYAGYWDAMSRISTLYLTLITTTLSLYWLPRIAEVRHWDELKEEILHVYKLVLPTILIATFGIYVLRDHLVILLFTPDFSKMEMLFAWQLAGDVLKICSWVLAFLMIGKGLTKKFIITEFVGTSFFVLFSVILTNHIGFKGVSLAHFITYFVYFILVYSLTIGTKSSRRLLFL